jgi:phosphate-selective porin
MKRYPWFGLVLVFGLWTAKTEAGVKNSATVEERLAQLEDEVKTLREENTHLEKNLGAKADGSPVFVQPFGKEASLKLGGFIQTQAEFGDKTDSRFSDNHDRIFLRRARINVNGKFAEHFEFKLEMELAGSLSEATALRAQLTDGYIQWSQYDEARVRVGQFKTPFGYEQLAYDPSLMTIERSLTNDRLTLSRQVGVQLAGDLLDKRLSYAGGVFNGTSVNTDQNDDSRFLIVGRVSGVAWEGQWMGQETKWTLGTNAFFSDDKSVTAMAADYLLDSTPGGTVDNIFSGNRRGFGADTQLVVGPFNLAAEYLSQTFRPSDRLPLHEFEADGYEIQAGYFVLPKRLQLVAKYEYFDPIINRHGGSSENRIAGLNYYVKGDDIKLQLNYYLSNPAGLPDNAQKILLRLQVIF